MKLHVNASSCTKLFIYLAVISATTFTSCKKESSDSDEAISEEEVTEVMSESVTPESNGVVAQVESSSQVSAIPFYISSLSCGVAKDSTIIHSGSKGDAYSWSSSLEINWLLSCSNGAPEKLDVTLSGSSEYEGPRLTSSHESSGSLTVSGLELSSTKYVVNETFVRTGSHVSKIKRMLSFTTQTTVNLTEILVDKLTKKIVSGAAAITVQGTNSLGKSFTYTGTFTFTGNSTGTLVLKNGHHFLFQW
jgi:hypothetical protein